MSSFSFPWAGDVAEFKVLSEGIFFQGENTSFLVFQLPALVRDLRSILGWRPERGLPSAADGEGLPALALTGTSLLPEPGTRVLFQRVSSRSRRFPGLFL